MLLLMEGLKQTVFIRDIPKDVDGKTFISYVMKGGTIQIHEVTGRHMAEMHIAPNGKYKEGIVTYASDIKEALKTLKDETLNEKYVVIREASDELMRVSKTSSLRHQSKLYNAAWHFWDERKTHSSKLDEVNNMNRGGKGGRGGRGGHSCFYSVVRYLQSSFIGQDGKPGEDGPGGRGGQGGRGGGFFYNDRIAESKL